ncbi:zinc finger protein 160-like isoform X1 [Mytilus edulis]|uniref:zinc finger protein 160-like isoform X1 n=2 Tax=Mytilus edulis TaxID=6550 RepID=UPI0039F03260
MSVTNINEESTTITAAMETDTLEEFDKDQFLEYSRLTTNKMLLAVTLDTGSMTMTSFASQLGNSFLQQSVEYAGLDILDELQKFLSDHYKTKKLKIENKSLKDESNDEDQKKTVRDRKRKQEGSPLITDKKQKVAEKDLKSMSPKKDMTRLTTIQTDNAMSRSGRKIRTPKWLLGNEISVTTGNEKTTNVAITKSRFNESADQIQSSVSRTSSVLKNVNKSEATKEKINPNKTSILIMKEMKVEIKDKNTSQESNKNKNKEDLADSKNKQDVKILNSEQNTEKSNNTQDTTDNGYTQNIENTYSAQYTKKTYNTQDTSGNEIIQDVEMINKDDDIDQEIKGFGKVQGYKVTDNEKEIKVETCEKEANDKNKIPEIPVEDNGQDENHRDNEHEKLKSNDSDEKLLHWAYGVAIDCEDKMKETKGIFKCRKCDEEMSSSLERVRHEVNDHNFIVMLKMKDHCAKPFKCPLCRRCMKFEESMRTHIIEHATADVTDLNCSVCKLQFINKFRLRDHMLTHGEAKFPCPNCGKKFRMKKYVRRHMIESCCSKFSADKNEECENGLPAQADTSIHRNLAVNNLSDDVTVMKVNDNGSQIMSGQVESVSVSKTEDSLDENFAVGGDAETSDLSGDKSSLKLNSDKIFADENEQAEGNIISSSPLTCEICQETFMKKWNLQRHMFRKHSNEDFQCEVCQQTFKKKFALHNHLVREHNFDKDFKVICSKAEVQSEKFKCRECNEIFFSSMERVRHELYDHELAVLERYTGPAKKGKFKCPICKNKRETVETMKSHIRDHFETDVSELTCSVCKLQFKTKNRLQNHLPIHSEPKYPCQKCGKKFRMLKYVKRHMLETHKIAGSALKKGKQDLDSEKTKEIKKQKKTPGICEVCGKVFSSLASALQHRSVHTQERKHSCKVCQKRFRLKSALRNHMRLHQDNKDFVCEVCGMSFKMAQGLRMHRLRYHERVQYKCDHCNRKFKCIGGKKYHFLKEHREIAELAGLKMYPCNFCDRISSSHQEFLRHESSHIDNKIHVCDLCNNRFPTISQLNEHKKSHFGRQKNYMCLICSFKASSPYKIRRHLASTKHLENCSAKGYNSIAAMNMDDPDIVKVPMKRERCLSENDVKNEDENLSTDFSVSVVNEQKLLNQMDISVGEDGNSQTEDSAVEVKYVEIPYNIEEGSHIIYSEDNNLVYRVIEDGETGSLVEGENTIIYDTSINQAVESILKLQQSSSTNL